MWCHKFIAFSDAYRMMYTETLHYLDSTNETWTNLIFSIQMWVLNTQINCQNSCGWLHLGFLFMWMYFFLLLFTWRPKNLILTSLFFNMTTVMKIVPQLNVINVIKILAWNDLILGMIYFLILLSHINVDLFFII